MKKQQKKDKSYLMAIALLLLAGFFVFLFLLPEKDPHISAEGAHSKDFEDRVNRHLFKTSQSIEMNQARMKIEAEKMAREGISPQAVAAPDVHNLDLSTDPRAEALLQALGRDVKEANGPASPDEQVQADLFESQQLQNYSEEYKKEYARQFVENARKAGYIIKLNDDYKVIMVRPIRKPAENYELFQSGGRSVR